MSANPNVPNEDNTGNAFASYLLGTADSAFRQFVQENKLRNFYVAPYFQDSIKLLPKLTVDLGLRWDIMRPFTDVHNDVVFLNTSLPNPGTITPTGTSLLGAATQLGSCALCAGYDRADYEVGPVQPARWICIPGEPEDGHPGRLQPRSPGRRSLRIWH